MQAYSMELRISVLAACDTGEQTKQVAARFAVSPAWVRRLKQRRREDGTIEPRPIPGCKPKLDDAAHLRLRQFVNEQPDLTLQQLRLRIADELNVRVSLGALWETLRRIDLPLKRSRSPQSRNRELLCANSKQLNGVCETVRYGSSVVVLQAHSSEYGDVRYSSSETR